MGTQEYISDFLFTSESVSEGHPDKVCDQISDALLDEYLKHDEMAHVAIETMALSNRVILGGEVRSNWNSNAQHLEEVVRNTVKNIGYEDDNFHWQKLQLSNFIHEQSSDIYMGVKQDDGTEGAGDQGIMFGYATNETKDLMPAPLHYAHEVLHNIMAEVKAGRIPRLGPDAKSQITILYNEKREPVRAEKIVISIQHPESLSQQEVREIVKPIVARSLPEGWMCKDENLYINPTGRFVIGGPHGDAGLTGRKIIVDTYGGASPHGGGAFSGKDPTKVDRSAAYMARHLAKAVVAQGLADRCIIQLSYAIGLAQPLSVYVHTSRTGKVPDKEIAKYIENNIDLTPAGIRKKLALRKPIYLPTATYGHFGREPKGDTFPWERELGESIKV
jgi:S-adenosylmethionine synthetase